MATTFDYPGATFTQPLGINAAGAVTGLFEDSVGVHGFVRDANGGFSSFDQPGSSYTVPWSINTSGEVAGFFYGGSAETQGFVRDALGNITVFTVPNAYVTTALHINYSASITYQMLDQAFPLYGVPSSVIATASSNSIGLRSIERKN